jgi:hypothetical protein
LRERKATKETFLVFSAITLLLFVSLVCMTKPAYGAFSPQLNSPAQTETTVTLSWTKSNDWLFKSYAVKYSTSVNGPFNTVATITDSSTTFFAVDGLSPSTSYYFIVEDSASEIISSSTARSNTLQVVTASIPAITIISKTSTTASLQWSDHNSYSSLVPFRSYVIQMSTNGGPWSTLTTVTDSSQNTYAVTGLSPATYGFRMYDEVGSSGQYTTISNVATLTINPPIQLQISGSTTSCDVNQEVQFTASASGGTNSYGYQWYLNGNPIVGATSANFAYTPTEAGTFSVHATVQDTQDSSLAIATSSTWAVTVTASVFGTIQGTSQIYIVIGVIAIIAVIVAVPLVMKRKQSSTRQIHS